MQQQEQKAEENRFARLELENQKAEENRFARLELELENQKAQPAAAQPAAAQPAAVQPPVRPQGVSFFDSVVNFLKEASPLAVFSSETQVGKGFRSGWETVKKLPEFVMLQQASLAADREETLLNALKKIDEGSPVSVRGRQVFVGENPFASTLAIGDVSRDFEEGRRARLIQEYASATPEDRAKLRASLESALQGEQKRITDALPAYAEYQKRVAPLEGKVPDITKVRGPKDFYDWLNWNVAAGTAQLLPVLASAAVTRGAGRVVGVGATSVGMALGETEENRLKFILDKVKTMPVESQAKAVQDYIAATNDVNMRTAFLSGALDVISGPVGTLVKAGLAQVGKKTISEIAKQAAEKITPKTATKEILKDIAEEGVTGGAQEGIQIGAERELGEQTGDIFSKENVSRVINSSLSEAAGSLVGSGVNIGVGAGKQMLFDAARERAEEALKQQAMASAGDDKDLSSRIANEFDRHIADIRKENPNLSESEVLLEAGKRLREEGVKRGRARADADVGGVGPSVPVPSGEERTGELAQEPAGAGVPPVGPSGEPVDGAATGEGQGTSALGEAAPVTPTLVTPAAAPITPAAAPVTPTPVTPAAAAVTPAAAPIEAAPIEAAPIEAAPVTPTLVTPAAALIEAAPVTPAAAPIEAAPIEAAPVTPTPKRKTAPVLQVVRYSDGTYGLDRIDRRRRPANEIIYRSEEDARAAAEALFPEATIQGEVYGGRVGKFSKKNMEGLAAAENSDRAASEADETAEVDEEVVKEANAYDKAARSEKVLDTPFNPEEYDSVDEAKAAAVLLQNKRHNAITDALDVVNDETLSPDSPAVKLAKKTLSHSSIDNNERNVARSRYEERKAFAKRTYRAGKAPEIAGSTNANTDTAFKDITDAVSGLDHIIKNGNPFEKLLARVLKPFAKNVKVIVVNEQNLDNIKDNVKTAIEDGSPGVYSTELSADGTATKVVYLADLPDNDGLNNRTLLHEVLHGATVDQVYKVHNSKNYKADGITPAIVTAVKELDAIRARAAEAFAELVSATEDLSTLDPDLLTAFTTGKALSSTEEFVTYGFTSPSVQEFLMTVPAKVGPPTSSVVSNFVRVVRRMFNIDPSQQNAMQDLIIATDALLSASQDFAVKAARRYTKKTAPPLFASKKAKATNKALQKIVRSHDPEVIGRSLGEVFRNTRNVKDAIRLLKATTDALTVGGIRKILYTLTTMDITRWVGDRIRNVNKINEAVESMAQMRNKMIMELAEKTPDWIEFSKKYEQGGRTLGDMMHLATLYGIDPSIYADVNEALNKDKELQKLNLAYQTAMVDPNVTPRQRSAAKGKVTARENQIKTLFDGGQVVNPNTGEKYVIEGWTKLGKYGNGEGHKIFHMARDTYKATFDLHMKILLDNINASNIPGNANNPNTPKGKLIGEITKAFQEANELGVYFPLMRYGNFSLRIGKGKQGEFYLFESAVARNTYAQKRADELGESLEKLESDGIFSRKDDLSSIRRNDAESSEMLKSIFKALDDNSSVNPATGKVGITNVDAIKDQVYQMFLATLPDKDMRRRFTHRQGKTGFSADVLRNFVASQHTAANQLARLKYANQIRLAIASSYAELEGNPDGLKLSTFVDEMAQRAQAELQPPNTTGLNWDALAAVGNKVVFYWMMTAPRTALVQFTQLPLVGMPILIDKYGTANTVGTMARYSLLFNKLGTTKKDEQGNIITKWGQPSINDSSYVNNHPDPEYRKILKAAWQAGQDKNLFGSTYTSDMTARSRVPTTVYQGVTSRVTRGTLNFISGALHHTERISREIMYMSTFELEFAKLKQEGLSDVDAARRAGETATNIVYESLFNYSQYNKPRLLKAGPITKLATQFMTYPMQMTSHLVRNFYGMLNVLNPEEQKSAAIKLFGTLGMTGLFAGITGMPLYSVIMGVAEGVKMAMGGDDEEEELDPSNPLGKRNIDLWFREWFIPTYFGPGSSLAAVLGLTDKQAEMMQRSAKMGAVSALTDLNIGSSVSLDGLFFHGDNTAETNKEAFTQFLFSTMTGPFGSMGQQIFSAFDEFENGEIVRGFEKLSPAFVRGLARSIRLGAEGERTRGGDILREAEWFNVGRLVGESLGFRSTELAELQKKQLLAKRVQNQVQDKRSRLLNAFDKAAREMNENISDKTIDNFKAVLDKIDKFNNSHIYYGSLITLDTLGESYQSRAKARSINIEGFRLTADNWWVFAPILERSREK